MATMKEAQLEMVQKIVERWEELEISGDAYRFTSDDYLRDALLLLEKSDDDAAAFVDSYGDEYYEYGCSGVDVEDLAVFITERVGL